MTETNDASPAAPATRVAPAAQAGAGGKPGNGARRGSPEDIASRMCQRVKELRSKQGWTLEEMSAACGVSRSMLSQIERNQANPTLGVAVRISQAFGMSLGELIDEPSQTQLMDVIRADDAHFHYRNGKDVAIRTLSPLHLEKDIEFYELTIKPGGALRSAAHFEGTREVLTVTQGKVRVSAGEPDDADSLEEADLTPGDSVHYHADVPHAIENVGETDAVMFLVDIYQSG